MSKGQEIIGQIFVYMLSAAVIIFVVVYGYGAVKNFKQKSEEIADIRFNQNLKESFNRLYTNIGSTIVYDNNNRFPVSSNYKKVCFAETDTNDYVSAEALSSYPLIKASICGSGQCNNCNDCSRDNVFLVTDDMEKSFYIKNLEVGNNNNFLCINVENGHINFKLESKGKYVLVTPID